MAAACLALLAGCGEMLTVTEAERGACDSKVAELTGRRAVGESSAISIHNRNGVKSIRLIYPQTSDFPAVQCDLTAGEVISIVKFETLFPVPEGTKA